MGKKKKKIEKYSNDAYDGAHYTYYDDDIILKQNTI